MRRAAALIAFLLLSVGVGAGVCRADALQAQSALVAELAWQSLVDCVTQKACGLNYIEAGGMRRILNPLGPKDLETYVPRPAKGFPEVNEIELSVDQTLQSFLEKQVQPLQAASRVYQSWRRFARGAVSRLTLGEESPGVVVQTLRFGWPHRYAHPMLQLPGWMSRRPEEGDIGRQVPRAGFVWGTGAARVSLVPALLQADELFRARAAPNRSDSPVVWDGLWVTELKYLRPAEDGRLILRGTYVRARNPDGYRGIELKPLDFRWTMEPLAGGGWKPPGMPEIIDCVHSDSLDCHPAREEQNLRFAYRMLEGALLDCFEGDTCREGPFGGNQSMHEFLYGLWSRLEAPGFESDNIVYLGPETPPSFFEGGGPGREPEPNRLAGTSEIPGAPIYVNGPLVERTGLDVPGALRLLVHEYGHHVGDRAGNRGYSSSQEASILNRLGHAALDSVAAQIERAVRRSSVVAEVTVPGYAGARLEAYNTNRRPGRLAFWDGRDLYDLTPIVARQLCAGSEYASDLHELEIRGFKNVKFEKYLGSSSDTREIGALTVDVDSQAMCYGLEGWKRSAPFQLKIPFFADRFAWEDATAMLSDRIPPYDWWRL